MRLRLSRQAQPWLRRRRRAFRRIQTTRVHHEGALNRPPATPSASLRAGFLPLRREKGYLNELRRFHDCGGTMSDPDECSEFLRRRAPSRHTCSVHCKEGVGRGSLGACAKDNRSIVRDRCEERRRKANGASETGCATGRLAATSSGVRFQSRERSSTSTVLNSSSRSKSTVVSISRSRSPSAMRRGVSGCALQACG